MRIQLNRGAIERTFINAINEKMSEKMRKKKERTASDVIRDVLGEISAKFLVFDHLYLRFMRVSRGKISSYDVIDE